MSALQPPRPPTVATPGCAFIQEPPHLLPRELDLEKSKWKIKKFGGARSYAKFSGHASTDGAMLCTNCGLRSHFFADCMGPLGTDYKLYGCPIHGTRDHSFDQCPHPAAFTRKSLELWLVKHRKGKAMIKSVHYNNIRINWTLPCSERPMAPEEVRNHLYEALSHWHLLTYPDRMIVGKIRRGDIQQFNNSEVPSLNPPVPLIPPSESYGVLSDAPLQNLPIPTNNSPAPCSGFRENAPLQYYDPPLQRNSGSGDLIVGAPVQHFEPPAQYNIGSGIMTSAPVKHYDPPPQRNFGSGDLMVGAPVQYFEPPAQYNIGSGIMTSAPVQHHNFPLAQYNISSGIIENAPLQHYNPPPQRNFGSSDLMVGTPMQHFELPAQYNIGLGPMVNAPVKHYDPPPQRFDIPVQPNINSGFITNAPLQYYQHPVQRNVSFESSLLQNDGYQGPEALVMGLMKEMMTNTLKWVSDEKDREVERKLKLQSQQFPPPASISSSSHVWINIPR